MGTRAMAHGGAIRELFTLHHQGLPIPSREGFLPNSPLDKMKPPKVGETSKKVYSLGELRSILKYLEKSRTALALRDYTLVSILADTGSRTSEVLSLTVDDLVMIACFRDRPKLTDSG